VPEGGVDLAWRLEEGRLKLTWTERGGPRVAAPLRKGFGTSVLARALGGTLGGASRLVWREDGLLCELELPLASADRP
jgi:two-component sensor histidine kinase